MLRVSPFILVLKKRKYVPNKPEIHHVVYENREEKAYIFLLFAAKQVFPFLCC